MRCTTSAAGVPETSPIRAEYARSLAMSTVVSSKHSSPGAGMPSPHSTGIGGPVLLLSSEVAVSSCEVEVGGSVVVGGGSVSVTGPVAVPLGPGSVVPVLDAVPSIPGMVSTGMFSSKQAVTSKQAASTPSRRWRMLGR
jgi:hypothetical protein